MTLLAGRPLTEFSIVAATFKQTMNTSDKLYCQSIETQSFPQPVTQLCNRRTKTIEKGTPKPLAYTSARQWMGIEQRATATRLQWRTFNVKEKKYCIHILKTKKQSIVQHAEPNATTGKTLKPNHCGGNANQNQSNAAIEHHRV